MALAAAGSSSLTQSGMRPGDTVDGERIAQYESELETLRIVVAAQEERVAKLNRELQAVRESERLALADAEAARQEAARLTEELRSEREARYEAVANAEAAAEAAALAEAAAMVNPTGSLTAGSSTAKRAQVRSARRAMSNSRRSGPQVPGGGLDGRTDDLSFATPATGSSARPFGDVSTSLDASSHGPGRRAAAPAPLHSVGAGGTGPTLGSRTTPKGRDEIDLRLQDYLERSGCNLVFRRLNRGWYAFRRADDKAAPSADRSVEVSIVNGKLMARLESSTHDAGWNNGKLGPIERFCHHFTHADGS